MTLDELEKAKKELSIFRTVTKDNPLLESADIQLQFLIDFHKRNLTYNDRLRQITVGVIAVREIEGINDELAEQLYQIDYWVKNELLGSVHK